MLAMKNPGWIKLKQSVMLKAGITMRMIDMEGKDSNKYKIKALDSSTWIDLGGGYCAGTWNNGNWQNNNNQSGSI